MNASDANDTPSPAKTPRAVLFWVPLALGLAYLGALVAGVDGFEGSRHWQWGWTHDDPWRIALAYAPAMAASLAAYLLIPSAASPGRRRIVLALLLLIPVLAQTASLLTCSEGFAYFTNALKDSGYYNDALWASVNDGWLAGFADWKRTYRSSTQPAGVIAYYYLFVRLGQSLFGMDPGQAYAGVAAMVCVMVLSASSVLVLFAASGRLLDRFEPRALCCLAYALAPGLNFFPTELDTAYPLFALGLIYFWLRAMHDKTAFALPFGAVLCVAAFTTYKALPFLAVIGVYTLFVLAKDGWSRAGIKRLIAAMALGLAACAALFFLIHLTWGYRPLDAFLASYRDQLAILVKLGRTCGLREAGYDVFEFAAATAVWPFVLAALAALAGKRAALTDGQDCLAKATVLGIVMIAVSCTASCETFRVWVLLVPLVFLAGAPVFTTMSRWRLGVLLGTQWLIIVAQKALLFSGACYR